MVCFRLYGVIINKEPESKGPYRSKPFALQEEHWQQWQTFASASRDPQASAISHKWALGTTALSTVRCVISEQRMVKDVKNRSILRLHCWHMFYTWARACLDKGAIYSNTTCG